MMNFRRICILDLQQAVEDVDEPMIGHGMLALMVGEERLFVVAIGRPGAGTATGGLMPALLSSTEPKGIAD